MDYYILFKFFHVLMIIVWLGGGFGLVILGMRAEIVHDDSELAHIVQQAIFMTKVFIPAALLAFLLGVIMVLQVWSFTFLWVIIGLTGFALTFGIGVLVLKPCSDRVGALIAKEGISREVVTQSRRFFRVVKFDFVMLFIVVADMVLKPTPDSYVVLTVMAIALLTAAVAFLGRRFQ